MLRMHQCSGEEKRGREGEGRGVNVDIYPHDGSH